MKKLFFITLIFLAGCKTSETSNEDYAKTIDEVIQSNFPQGSMIVEVENYLKGKGIPFTKLNNKKCLDDSKIFKNLDCGTGPYIQALIDIKKPFWYMVESAGSVQIYFNKKNELTHYKVDITHTFL